MDEVKAKAFKDYSYGIYNLTGTVVVLGLIFFLLYVLLPTLSRDSVSVSGKNCSLSDGTRIDSLQVSGLEYPGINSGYTYAELLLSCNYTEVRITKSPYKNG